MAEIPPAYAAAAAQALLGERDRELAELLRAQFGALPLPAAAADEASLSPVAQAFARAAPRPQPLELRLALRADAAPAAETAAALRARVESSGLFYESHLAEWVRGERPGAELQEEAALRTKGAAAG